MKFAVLTHIEHKERNGQYYSYEPYVREMNLWFKHVDEVKVVGAYSDDLVEDIETVYQHENLTLKKISSIDITSISNVIKAIFKIPIIFIKLFNAMLWADHIHLRCPSNIGLLGSLIQILFPSKQKTVKYAGNWDPNSKQPWSYRLQKWILSNTFLTKNCKVLVYGDWPYQSKNIAHFFTASYSKSEIEEVEEKNLNGEIKFIYVGGFTKGKQPLLAVKAVEQLYKKAVKVRLDMYGDGTERVSVSNYIDKNNLESVVFVHGNVSKEVVKEGFQQSHFLVFISKSEGWPKVVAEAMFWGCVPITTAVSCVPYMLDYGNRGSIVDNEVNSIVVSIQKYLEDENLFKLHSLNGKQWSQQFTLEKFESEIKKLLIS